MKLSEAIIKLQELLEKHGDADFVCLDADEGTRYHYNASNFTFDRGQHVTTISYWENECAE